MRRVEVSNKASKIDGIHTKSSCWIPKPVSCHSPEAASTISKCSWRWTQKASETCRGVLQLQINLLPSCITLVLLYILCYLCCTQCIMTVYLLLNHRRVWQQVMLYDRKGSLTQLNVLWGEILLNDMYSTQYLKFLQIQECCERLNDITS